MKARRLSKFRRLAALPPALLALPGSTAGAFAQTAGPSGSGLPAWFVAVPLVVAAVGLGLGWYAWRQWSIARASRAWPTVAGTVIETELTSRTETYRQQDRLETHIVFAPRVRYAYEVEGRRYESERIRFGSYRESEAAARAILDRYPVGAAVEVHFDPADPAAATLETKTVNVGMLLFAVIALLGLAVFIAVMLLM